MSTLPKVEDVRPILEPFEVRLRKVLEDAWNEDWLKIEEHTRSVMDTTTRANVMFNFVRHRALAEFQNDDEITILPTGRSVKFLFGSRVLVRLKKASPKSGLGSNIPTQATLEYINHPQRPLFSDMDVYHVDVLYQEDSFATRIESIAATCRLGLQKLWSYELQRSASSSSGSVIPIPSPQLPDGGQLQPAEVRPRNKTGQADVKKPEFDRG